MIRAVEGRVAKFFFEIDWIQSPLIVDEKTNRGSVKNIFT